MSEADRIFAALLRVVQRSNDCQQTGRECRAKLKCGCWMEAQAEIEDAP